MDIRLDGRVARLIVDARLVNAHFGRWRCTAVRDDELVSVRLGRPVQVAGVLSPIQIEPPS